MRVIAMFAALATALSAATASATAISWSFSGAPYDGSGSVPDLGGKVIVTLDDEDTAKTVKIKIDASGLADTDAYVRYFYLNTIFDSSDGDNAIFVEDIFGSAAGSFQSATNNEDGLAAGSGGSFDFRLNFFEDGSDYFSGGEIFEATLRQNSNDLLTSSFLDVSFGGTAGAFDNAFLIRTPDNVQTPSNERTNDYFSGERVVAVPVAGTLPLLAGGLGLAGFTLRRRNRKGA